MLYKGFGHAMNIRYFTMHALIYEYMMQRCFTWKHGFWHALVRGPCVAWRANARMRDHDRDTYGRLW